MNNNLRRSVAFSRRSFVEKMGLGMGAALLAPLASNLIREAQGQDAPRKLAMFWMACNGINPYWVFTPKEFAEPTPENQQEPGSPSNSTLISASSTEYTLPAAFKPLEASYRNQLVMVDGLRNHPRKGEDGGHGLGYMALSCVPGSDPDNVTAGGITYDQHLANTIGSGTPRKSVLIGVSSHVDKDMKPMLFAGGANQPIDSFQSPALLYKDLFGTAMVQASGMGTPSVKNRLIFEGLRYDLDRLKVNFAGEERAKLDKYLAVVEAQEKSLNAAAGLTCTGGTAPTAGAAGEPVAGLEALNAMASIALTCGMTNVMGVDIGCGDSHDFGPDLAKLLVGTPLDGTDGTSLGDVGHMDQPINGPVISGVYAWMSGMVAATLDALKTIPSGNGTLFDNALAMLVSDNGETHHSRHLRMPFVLVGKAGGLKLDGRYIRYPGSAEIGFQDALLAMGQGLGAPSNGFGVHADGQGFMVPSKGPLPELL